MTADLNRRELTKSVAQAIGVALAGTAAPAVLASDQKPALLGGKPVRTQPFPSWPQFAKNEEDAWMEVLRSRKWCRLDGDRAKRFEAVWAKTLGAKECVAAASGTTALSTVLNALDIGPGDEMIVPPYTFVATINVVLLQHALPVFVDTDRETFQIDANKIEAAITPRTRAIMPVHLGGSAADLDKILAIGKAHNLPVVEDACQAHLAEWRGKKVGTLGTAGCFSFQGSKNLNCGEGGAIVTNDDALRELCQCYLNNGRGATTYGYRFVRNGSNHRMTEFQATLLMEQLTRLEAQARTREQNAQYLTALLKEVPGIRPARMYDGCTRNAYHLYMFRYDREKFAGLPLDRVVKAIQAEGVPASTGYVPLNKEPVMASTLRSRHFRKCFSQTDLDRFEERTACPENDKLCQEAVWLTQTMLLGAKSDMDDIAAAVRKVQQGAAELNRA
ncbi:DegT/DnrJ/EryC1/StrS family aminotransferase [uncultured Paludibaculum sp.]|uniref:DegT/DnrJ/EryC1/StrS family aminotransferase n=1 Tax=uncultured Paludibaculum sp. TaxID=1765020 RepID=UPI002AAC07E1|nr:DegT/DnrJ/EryC1/StrS family aminotransferase [uncultured Paludibaculum sp.]